jgi:hypothetical protein
MPRPLYLDVMRLQATYQWMRDVVAWMTEKRQGIRSSYLEEISSKWGSRDKKSVTGFLSESFNSCAA